MAILFSPITFVASIPFVTRIVIALTLILSPLTYWLRWKGVNDLPFLTFVPGTSWFYPYTFVSSAFVELNIVEFLITLLIVPSSLRYIERLWGSVETAKFIVVTVGLSNVIAFGFNWLEFLATGNLFFLHGMEYKGSMSLQIGILVAFTQLIPEHQIQVFGVLKTRVKNLPMAYLGLSTVMTFLGYQSPWIIIQFGWFVSWIYLRFYKKNSSDTPGGNDTYGDRSETFALVAWFPPFVHKPITLLGNTVYSLATKFHLIPASMNDLESGMYTQVPGSARAEAERRRAMALKALDQRIANSSSPGPGQQPGGSSSQPATSSASTPASSPSPAKVDVAAEDVELKPVGPQT